MLKGIFNSIILVGRLARRIVAHVARHHVRIEFNHHAHKDEPVAVATYAPGTPANTLRGRFNGCNDNFGFSAEGKEKEDKAREALIRGLIDLLKEVARNVAEGTAPLAQALALVSQLESLGIRISGLPIYAPETVVDHTKTPYIRHVHERPTLAA